MTDKYVHILYLEPDENRQSTHLIREDARIVSFKNHGNTPCVVYIASEREPGLNMYDGCTHRTFQIVQGIDKVYDGIGDYIGTAFFGVNEEPWHCFVERGPL